MKLYEFVDKLYEMGDMESPETIRSKRTLNESVSSRYEIRGYDSVDGSIDTKELLVKDRETKQVYHYIDLLKLVRRFSKQNGFEIDEQQVSEIIRKLVKELTQPDAEDIRDIIALFLMQEDDLDEGILGGLAGAAIGGLAGNSLGHPVLGAIGGGLAGSAIQNALNDDLNEEPKDEEQLNEEIEEVTEDKDLSTVKGSMTQILQDNREKIDACSSAQEVHDVVAGLLAEAGLDTQATRRLLLTLKKQRGLTGALQAVYNSILKGSDLGVIKEAANTNPSRYRVKGCNKNGRVENHDQFMIFDSEYSDEIDYYDLCEIIRDVNEDNDLSSSQVEDIATDVISELYFQTPDEDLGEIISMYSY